MIVKNGIEEFGVNKLAKEVGVSPGTVYIYFKDKEDLLLTLCLEVSSNILEASIKDLLSDTPFEKGMKLQWRNRYFFYKKYPDQVEFIEKVRYTYIYESIKNRLTDAYGKVLGGFIEKAVQDKKLAVMPFEMYWSLAFAPLYQLINFNKNNGEKKHRFVLTEPMLNEVLRRVLQALKL